MAEISTLCLEKVKTLKNYSEVIGIVYYIILSIL